MWFEKVLIYRSSGRITQYCCIIKCIVPQSSFFNVSTPYDGSFTLHLNTKILIIFICSLSVVQLPFIFVLQWRELAPGLSIQITHRASTSSFFNIFVSTVFEWEQCSQGYLLPGAFASITENKRKYFSTCLASVVDWTQDLLVLSLLPCHLSHHISISSFKFVIRF